MCGIVAVVYDASDVCTPDGFDLVNRMNTACRMLTIEASRSHGLSKSRSRQCTDPGRRPTTWHRRAAFCSTKHPSPSHWQISRSTSSGQIAALESTLQEWTTADDDLERLNAATVALKDAWWSISRDRLPSPPR